MSERIVRKAIIPAAGLGTRMYPATKALKKELLPIIDRDGRAKPIILAIVEEAISAGIEEVGIVVQPGDRDLFYDLFKSPPKPELWSKLSAENKQYSEYLVALGDRITILTQTEQQGFGHAVYCARDWVDNQPFLLLLGDHVYTSAIDSSCAAQMIDIYQQHKTSVIGITIMQDKIIHKAGCVSGKWKTEQAILEIAQIYEKPTLEYAREHLQVPGMANDEFLGVFGMYVLEPVIFELLALEIDNNERFQGEFQLTTCLDKLRQQHSAIAYLVQGQYYDTGMPLFYRQALIDYYRRAKLD
ncbi:UTP--glucose-1-phosphate uridylyltransferase [Pleurocapsa sp. CCALA 161]|uniref:UTP--glucose-1-phosphate uridylyltransferase n=1 Tax=Pleurocapsa sp. CCALA 161 TaxID=2107688 RepID=UPI000D074628|nr:UTP--glucose-1-phosphate uridylyltransferase [Pleurocapsa sp. CCALA 161]PSB12117.1 UTP--glucose-1-phosphate uridylyltransferase [Pleurocapsa sp. CCALA 161]